MNDPLRNFESGISQKTQFIPVRGLEEKILASDYNNGYVYFATDTGKIYIDTETEEKVLMGGSSGIFYGEYEHINTPNPDQQEFIFSINDLEDQSRIPNVDDLILNIPDGCFYRVNSVSILDNDTLIYVTRLTLAGGGGGEISGGTGKCTWITPQYITGVFNKPLFIEFDIDAKDDQGQPINTHRYAIKAERTESNIIPNRTVKEGSIGLGKQEIDISDFLNELGTWRVQVIVYIDIGASVPKESVRNFTVTVTSISLTWDYDEATLNNVSNTFDIKDWSFIGSGNSKQIQLTIDSYNKLPLETLNKDATTKTITINPIELGLSHGYHTIEMQGIIDVQGEIIYTDSVYKNVIFFKEGNEDIIISCNLFNKNLVQYNTVSIPIVIYNPNSPTSDLTLIENNVEKTTWQDVENGKVYNWLYTPLQSGNDIPLTIKCGTHELTIIVNIAGLDLDNEEVEGYSLRFKASEMTADSDIRNWAAAGNKAEFSDNFDWNNCGLNSEKDNYGQDRQFFRIKTGNKMTFNITPFGQEVAKTGLSVKLIYKTTNCRDYDAKFLTCYDPKEVIRFNNDSIELSISEGENIEYSSSVIISDSTPSLNSKYGGTISYSSDNFDIIKDKYIEYQGIIYRFTYKINEDEEIEPIFSSTYIVDLGVGFNFYAQYADFSCDSTSISVPYYEESYIELEFDISQKKDNVRTYVQPWLDGVPAGVTLYDPSDSILQNSPQKITIGSDECDVQLYMFKVYQKSLTDEEHLQNFIADAPNANEMLRRYERNDILDTQLTENYKRPIISYSKLSEKNKDCHVHLYSIERMTKTKSDPVGVYEYRQYYGGKQILNTATSPIKEQIRNSDLTKDERSLCPAQIKVQGTSSAAYGLAAFNIDTNYTYTTADGEENVCSLYEGDTHLSDGWSMTEQSIPCTFFCTKVNVASAEGVNNALNQEWYNYHQPYIGAARQRNYDENGKLKSGPLYRDTMEFQPGVIFVKDWNQTTNGVGVNNNVFKELSGYTNSPSYMLYSVGCMGNSKDNVHVFHTTTECCIENKDNQLPGQWMTICPGAYSDGDTTSYIDLDDLEGDITLPNGETRNKLDLWRAALDDVYEFRYPDGLDSVDKLVDDNGSSVDSNGKKYSDLMIKGWFEFVKWMSTSDPMPKYQKVDISNEEEFNSYNKLFTREETRGESGEEDDYDVKYESAESYIVGTDYYQETVHVHGFDEHKLRKPVTYPDYEFKGNQYSKTLAGCTVKGSGGIFTHDTQQYRIAKMLDKCEDYLVMDSVVYHYLFIERHTMVDNVAKNTFWSSSDYKHWDLTKDYDNDTADGNDNQGKLTLTYGLEIGDTINNVSVFNANNSVWLNFIRLIPDACTHMYEILEKAGAWTAKTYLEDFNKWQSTIPERCWIEDYYRKYKRPWEVFGDNSFLARMEGGKKTHQRAQYENYQEEYLASKHQSSKNEEIRIGFRPEMKDGEMKDIDITITTYADCYVNISVGSASWRIRAKRNEPIHWIAKEQNLKNATLYFYGANLLQSLGDETQKGNSFGVLNISTMENMVNATKLRKIVLSTFEENAVNSQLDKFNFGITNPDGSTSSSERTLMLEKIYACNFTFKGSNYPLNLEKCTNLQLVDVRGSNIAYITIANGAPLDTLRASSPTGLILSNLREFNTYEATFDLINKLEINNIDSGNSTVSSKYLVENSIRSSSNFNDYSLLNINWIIDSPIEMTEDDIIILNTLKEEHSDRVKDLPSSMSGNIIITEDAYNYEKSLSIYEKYADKRVYPNLNIDFLNENSKLYKVEVVDGNNKVIWHRKIKPGAEMDENFFDHIEGGFIPPLGDLNLSNIQKSNTNTVIYTKTGKWNIYNADTGELLEQVESNTKEYPDYKKPINSNIRIEHYFEESIRYYNVIIYDGDLTTILAEFKGDGTETGYGRIVYNTPLKDVISKLETIPYKDDSKLGLKQVYNHIGYHFNQESSVALPENTYSILSDIKLYPIFEEKDITETTPHYEYFRIAPATVSYNEGNYVSGLANDIKKYDGYELSPKIQLRGKILLPTKDESGNPIVRYKSFAGQKDITHIFFSKEPIDHLFELSSECFIKDENLQYFDFHKNLGMIHFKALQLTNLQTNLYNDSITLGENLIYIGELGLNQAFRSIHTPQTNMPLVQIPDRLTKIDSGGLIINNGFKGYHILIGGKKETLSNLDLSNVSPRGNGIISCNADAQFAKISFYTNKYTDIEDLQYAFSPLLWQSDSSWKNKIEILNIMQGS